MIGANGEKLTPYVSDVAKFPNLKQAQRAVVLD
jgi:hypothetical protein